VGNGSTAFYVYAGLCPLACPDGGQQPEPTQTSAQSSTNEVAEEPTVISHPYHFVRGNDTHIPALPHIGFGGPRSSCHCVGSPQCFLTPSLTHFASPTDHHFSSSYSMNPPGTIASWVRRGLENLRCVSFIFVLSSGLIVDYSGNSFVHFPLGCDVHSSSTSSAGPTSRLAMI